MLNSVSCIDAATTCQEMIKRAVFASQDNSSQINWIMLIGIPIAKIWCGKLICVHEIGTWEKTEEPWKSLSYLVCFKINLLRLDSVCAKFGFLCVFYSLKLFW